jgi:hypothetical protein
VTGQRERDGVIARLAAEGSRCGNPRLAVAGSAIGA